MTLDESAPRPTAELTRSALLVAVLLALGAGIWFLGTRSPTARIKVEQGIRFEKAQISAQFRYGAGQLFTIADNGDWCFADSPATGEIRGELPVTGDEVATATIQLRCTSSPVDDPAIEIGNVDMSPAGSGMFAVARDEATQQLTFFLADTASLEVRSFEYPATRGAPAWVGEDELLYYEGDAWTLATSAGTALLRIPGPAPGGPIYRISESLIVYLTPPPQALVRVDLTAAETAEVGQLTGLDPVLLMGVTPDLSRALVWDATRTSLGLAGTSVFVYDLDTGRVIPHAPPGTGDETQSVFPFLVGDDRVAYSAATTGFGAPAVVSPSVYVAPIDNPDAAIEIFTGGFVLIDAESERLLIDNLASYVILELAG
jgi:hypothetical protein